MCLLLTKYMVIVKTVFRGVQSPFMLAEDHTEHRLVVLQKANPFQSRTRTWWCI